MLTELPPEALVGDPLDEQLVIAVAEFNEPLATPEERIRLHCEIKRLRGHLRKGEP